MALSSSRPPSRRRRDHLALPEAKPGYPGDERGETLRITKLGGQEHDDAVAALSSMPKERLGSGSVDG